MNRRSFLMFFGDIDIYSNYKDHYASNISEGFLKTSSRYTKITHNGIYVGSEDLQKNPIKYYYEVDKRLKTDIRDVIKQIEEEVDKLDINSIIDSYETTISEWTKTKIGDDDTFYSETHRCSYYSDAYLETILPRDIQLIPTLYSFKTATYQVLFREDCFRKRIWRVLCTKI